MDAGLDAAIICSGPLADSGFSTLAELPVAELCTDSVKSGSGLVLEGMTSCAGTIMVSEGMGTDCGSWWLFESTTGALKASGGGCNTGLTCTGAAPGFSFPNQCFNGFLTQFWGETQELCPDGS